MGRMGTFEAKKVTGSGMGVVLAGAGVDWMDIYHARWPTHRSRKVVV